MKKIKIQTPIWKNKSVGIAEDKITEDIQVEVMYRNIYGDRIFPNTYYITKNKALNYPTQIRRGRKLRIIPLADMQELTNV
ncbi:MAG: hypothetical protein ACTSUF_10210 [Candidatus Heimdallarchaeaceae archaeon]